MVYGIVQQHQGTIAVESEAGKGAVFTIRLPAHEGLPRQAAEQARAEFIGAAESATVLVAEDDDMVRPLVVGVLTRGGYRVLAADSGRAAMALWKEHRSEIRLLLTDLLMPGGMTGKDLALRLRAEAPDLPVVLMTGYGAELQEKDGTIVPNAGFLQKPCTAEAILAAVGERMARR
jgi:CheY-like chemotaxis protein